MEVSRDFSRGDNFIITWVNRILYHLKNLVAFNHQDDKFLKSKEPSRSSDNLNSDTISNLFSNKGSQYLIPQRASNISLFSYNSLTHLLTHSFSKYSLSTDYMQGIVTEEKKNLL